MKIKAVKSRPGGQRVKTPWYTLRRLCLPEGDRCQKNQLYYICALISNVSIIILSCPSTQFYVFIDVEFFYTEQVSFIYVEQLCWFFLNNYFIHIYPVLYDYYYFGGCRASGYV